MTKLSKSVSEMLQDIGVDESIVGKIKKAEKQKVNVAFYVRGSGLQVHHLLKIRRK